MYTLSQVTWMTLWGLSLLFVGGFVLWVYGTQRERPVWDLSSPENEGAPYLRSYLVRWFLVYGGMAVFAGIGLLLTTAVLIL
ncbi:MAG: hypothetical protein WC521_04315 [Bdellovibrionales bacterium]